MDFDLRLKALARLVQSETEAATAALRREFEKVEISLAADTQYEILEQNLNILEVIGYRFAEIAVKVLSNFIQTIDSREITYAHQDPMLIASTQAYHNTTSLIVRAIQVCTELRYFDPKPVLHILLDLSIHTADEVQKKAFEGLSSLANYEIGVFYGRDTHPGIGALPQQQIVEELEGFEPPDLRKYFNSIVVIADALLSPTIQGSSWSYKHVTFSRTTTPSHPTVADVRRRSIELLRKLYGLANQTSQKVSVLNALKEATTTDHLGKTDENTRKMIARDTIAVLQFFESLVMTEELSVIQNIESKSYWTFFHAIQSDVEAAALAVQTAVAQHAEYQIYKVLIGFEGIFGDWTEMRKADSHWEGLEDSRSKTALEYAQSINVHNYAEWRERILKFAKTESNDLATFPIFYQFLEAFALGQPQLALRLITEDSEEIANFLIPILRGLSEGPLRDATRALVRLWITNGSYLYQASKQFLRSENLDRDLLRELLRRSEELRDLRTISVIIAVAISNYHMRQQFLIDDLFLPALQVLTKNSNADWIFDIWFRREMREVISDLKEDAIDSVLRNLIILNKIDYHGEEVLYLIAQRFPERVLHFLCQRLDAESDAKRKRFKNYDAVPYELHKLNEPLSKIPKEAVGVLRHHYDSDSEMFFFRGAHLLKTIFPHFPPEFEAELLNLVREGGETNFRFVLAILRNYQGRPFIHRICKEIIRRIPADSTVRTHVAMALENTGVVIGEFGFAEAYEGKKNEIKDWLGDSDEKVQDFARWYIANLDGLIITERKRAEEDIALRKLRYGDGDSE